MRQGYTYDGGKDRRDGGHTECAHAKGVQTCNCRPDVQLCGILIAAKAWVQNEVHYTIHNILAIRQRKEESAPDECDRGNDGGQTELPLLSGRETGAITRVAPVG